MKTARTEVRSGRNWFSIGLRFMVLLAIFRITALNEFVADSVVARAADKLPVVSDMLIRGLAALSVVGWVDLLLNDVLGLDVTYGIKTKLRHMLCVAYHGLLAGLCGVLAYVAADLGVRGGWIVVVMYCGIAIGSILVSAGIAHERRFDATLPKG